MPEPPETERGFQNKAVAKGCPMSGRDQSSEGNSVIATDREAYGTENPNPITSTTSTSFIAGTHPLISQWRGTGFTPA